MEILDENQVDDPDGADPPLGTYGDRCKLSGILICASVLQCALFAIIICGDPCLSDTLNNHIFLIICVTIFAVLASFLRLLATNLVFRVIT